MPKRKGPGSRDRQESYDNFVKDMYQLVAIAEKRKLKKEEASGLRMYISIMARYRVK